MIVSVLFLTLGLIDAHWALLLACPKVETPGNTVGTGVVIGVKDGFAYVLTASHVVPFAHASVQFASPETYPQAAWVSAKAEILARWPDPDLAVLRFPVGKREVPILRLAPSWQRPKTFPVNVVTVGLGQVGARRREASTERTDVLEAKEFVYREGKEPAFFWRTQLPSERGRSGGPLLDQQGRVIGIAVAVRGGCGYYSHHDEIVAALKRSDLGWLVPSP